MEFWKPEFTFVLLPLGLNDVDVLRALLRDAQEEIRAQSQIIRILREDVAVASDSAQPFFVATHDTGKTASRVTPNSTVCWDGNTGKYTKSAAYSTLASKNFIHSSDKAFVTIVKSGLYQVNLNLSLVNTANGLVASFCVDKVPTLEWHGGNNTGYQFTHSSSDILLLRAGNKCSVQYHGNSSIVGDHKHNRLTFLYLGGMRDDDDKEDEDEDKDEDEDEE
jgi:hypothetical protein